MHSDSVFSGLICCSGGGIMGADDDGVVDWDCCCADEHNTHTHMGGGRWAQRFLFKRGWTMALLVRMVFGLVSTYTISHMKVRRKDTG